MTISIVCRETVWCAALCLPILPAIAQRQSPAYTESVVAIQKQMQSGDLDGARAAIAQALKKYPADGGLENLLGVIEVQEGHVDAARRDFLSAVRHDPHLAGAYLNLARIDMQT